MAGTAEKKDPGIKIRKPAVAGQFYPENPEELKNDIAAYMKVSKSNDTEVRFLISPHAGYVFSGPVAGKGYAVLDKNVNRVIVIGPSHRAYFKGIVLPSVAYYQTPLGNVKIDSETVEKMRTSPIVANVSGADELEHCLEVQLPFLQVQLKDFTLVPVLVGDADPQQVASVIEPFIDDKTAVIASSDLSHYHPNTEARLIDDKSIKVIMDRNISGVIDGCGGIPIKTVMHLAEKKSLVPRMLDARTSYDVAPHYGSASRVVGYVSIAYVDNKENGNIKNDTQKAGFSIDQKKFLLNLARENLNAAVRKQTMIVPASIPQEFKEHQGCFVTIKTNGMLRGCIGYIEPIKPLYEAIIDNAANAALKDPRFSPVQEKELGTLELEISVLSKPMPFEYKDTFDLLQKLIPEYHGVILQKGPYQSTFLPQVWEQLPDKIMFLEHLAVKAGLSKDGWKTATYKVYTAQHFNE